MKTQAKTREYKIDASGRKLGRIASEVAQLLLGKDSPDFAKNVVAPVKVKINNVSKMDLGSKKLEDKTYISYSDYPGGQKEKSMQEIINHKGYSEVLRRAVYGMLPGNKLRNERMKNLSIDE